MDRFDIHLGKEPPELPEKPKPSVSKIDPDDYGTDELTRICWGNAPSQQDIEKYNGAFGTSLRGGTPDTPSAYDLYGSVTGSGGSTGSGRATGSGGSTGSGRATGTDYYGYSRYYNDTSKEWDMEYSANYSTTDSTKIPEEKKSVKHLSRYDILQGHTPKDDNLVQKLIRKIQWKG